ncbi:hypothetical protein SLA2020_140400 [Shorea laevis]
MARLDGCCLQKVSELMDMESHDWRHEVVESTFSAYDVQRILGILLSWKRFEDGWVWQFTKHGGYTMKLGYYVAYSMFDDTVDRPSGSEGQFQACSLWKLQIPKKVRLLTWSAYRGVLPSKDNLC